MFLVSCSLFATVPGDEHWDAQFGGPGVTNTPLAIAASAGTIYAVGAPLISNGTNVPLYAWDGNQWTVAANFNGPNLNVPGLMQVNDLAFVGNTLYAAGSFTNVNGVVANGLAKWDGTAWSGIGFSGVAFGLAVVGNNLYVSGFFTNAGGVLMTNIGYWDGAIWHGLGDGLGVAGTLSYVHAVAVKGGLLYAGGSFTNSGSQFITNLAVWNGVAWSPAGSGINGQVNALAINNNNDLYVGGAFTQAGGMSASGIAKWDGANWSALGSGLSGGAATANSIAVLNGTVYVAGSFTNAGGILVSNLAAWNGSFWSGAAGSLSSTGFRTVSDGNNLYVGGTFTEASNAVVGGIASWNGARWSVFGTPGRLNGILNSATILSSVSGVMALANDGTNLYAAGNFTFAGPTNANYIARFNGRNWKPVGPGVNSQVVALAVTNNRVYAGGYFTGTADGNVALSHIGYWDGTNWNAMGDPGGAVFALASSTNGLYAAGTAYAGPQFPSPYGSPFFSRWDGTNWYNALNFSNDCTFFTWPLNYHDSTGYCALAIQSTNIYLGGNIKGFTQYDPALGPGFSPMTNCQNIIRFDPNYGWIMGAGLNGYPVAMAVVGMNLFAAGRFTLADGVAANQIARWDGAHWSNVGGSVIGNGTVLSLTASGNILYAGGTFTNIGNVSANRIAKWDGTNWSAFAGGVSSSVFGLTTIGSDLYAAGSMKMAGGKASVGIARWNNQVNFNAPQLDSPIALTNRQFQARLLGLVGLTNIVQASTDLVSWTSVFTNTAGVVSFVDSNSPAYPHQFYRAMLGP